MCEKERERITQILRQDVCWGGEKKIVCIVFEIEIELEIETEIKNILSCSHLQTHTHTHTHTHHIHTHYSVFKACITEQTTDRSSYPFLLCKRALESLKRALYAIKRALYYTHAPASGHAYQSIQLNSRQYLLRSAHTARKSPICPQKSPILHTRTSVGARISEHPTQLSTISSSLSKYGSKELYISPTLPNLPAKEPYTTDSHQLLGPTGRATTSN